MNTSPLQTDVKVVNVNQSQNERRIRHHHASSLVRFGSDRKSKARGRGLDVGHQCQEPGVERAAFRLLGQRDKRPAPEDHEPVAERGEAGHSSHHAGGLTPRLRSALTASMRRPLP